MILSVHNLTKTFGEDSIVENGSFSIKEQEKVALVGPNGAGKTTILKMLVGELSLDAGEIYFAHDASTGYLAQIQEMHSQHTIYSECQDAVADVLALEDSIRQMEIAMKHLTGAALEQELNRYHQAMTLFESRNGYAIESEITGVLKGLGFTEEEFEKPVSTLSGGEKTRVSLSKLLLTKPDILLLDEPTNHLDIQSVEWLENFLLNYRGAVLLVSHDRYFLDRIVTKVIEVEHGKLRSFSGNYSAFADQKKALREAQINAFLNQQNEIRHQEAVIEKLRSFNREKSIKRAESREKTLQKMERVEAPLPETQKMHFSLHPSVLSGQDVLVIEDLGKRFDTTLFAHFSDTIRRGEHVAIIGNNGTGKTSLLKIINQVITQDTGTVKLGSNVLIGYYDQEYHVLDETKTIFEEISDTYPQMTGTRIRNILAAFLFTGDDVFKPISLLSGGEKGRVSLAKLMLSEANFLILDEPTNHLDIDSKEILEQALNHYTGTILYVSHDRYFINQTATRILELSNQRFTNYIGNYDYYLEKKDSSTPSNTSDSSTMDPEEKGAAIDWKQHKEQLAKERKQKNDLKKAESLIADLEQQINEIDQQMLLPEIYSNSAKCQELSLLRETLESKLTNAYEDWDQLIT